LNILKYFSLLKLKEIETFKFDKFKKILEDVSNFKKIQNVC